MLNIIEKDLISVAKKLNLQNQNFTVEKTTNVSFGDFSTNLALLNAKTEKKNPKLLAEEIAKHLHSDLYHVEIAGPGFINFHFSHNFYNLLVNEVIKKEDKYSHIASKPKKVNLEYVSANPTGTLHLGNARNGAIGDSLARIFKATGNIVEREYYINDAGNQINSLIESVEARWKEIAGFDSTMPQDGYYGQEIKEIAKQLYKNHKKSLPNRNELRKFVVSEMLRAIKEVLEKFGITYDIWFSETKLYENNEELIKAVLAKLEKNKKLYTSEGATFLSTTPDGDDKDRVVIKSDKTYSYLLPDIAYHNEKFSRNFDMYINILGADHFSYATRIRSAIKSLNYDASKLHVIIIQMVKMILNGEEVKMSKRTGKAITIEDLIETIGVDAARWYMVQKSPNTHVEIDVHEALSKSSANPVYYVQYAHARANQLIAKVASFSETKNFKLSPESINSAKEVLTRISNYQNTLKSTLEHLEPHRLTNYLYDLASAFHSYYNSEKVIDDTNITTTMEKLAIVRAAQIIIANGLKLVGVSAPTNM